MEELIVQQLIEFKSFCEKFRKKDEEIEKIFESGNEPTKKETREFEKLKKEYKDFLNFFEKFNGNYWGTELDVVTVAQRIINESLIAPKKAEEEVEEENVEKQSGPELDFDPTPFLMFFDSLLA